ncbi:uncharacterized protein LOC133797172 [Humulus lupulus]|uniref:uncharacterized protein LOC133797172 n=1 Tax=Humulus lupulus TaxID=3486 RepID=UPI002B4125B9|nr:uncharacterized protein LOC133797172 [Humulus lupulus]
MSMLHRSFKPAKCKTALKLSVSRIKLLNNKRENQVKQMKRELAQLLESGQIPTARIRVEHVIREEKTLTAYNFIEVYCELIAARLPIIESQKNCPIDLKEAITSVIFAAPRCADIPELADIRKQFTTKYGKEFVSAAIDLRPDCGVNRVLVEKLSAKAPDGPTKLKVLNAIAEEHNVKWNPDSFGGHDSNPSQDLLNGPNNLEMMSKVHTEVSPGPVWIQDDKGPPNVQVPHKYNQRHDASVNFNEQNVRPTSGYQKNSSTDVAPGKATISNTFHTEVRSSGHAMDRMEHNQSVSGNENAHSLGRQNWNVQFKDATSAAQAAAESAELASMAARAAAELSRQYSSESHKLSPGYVQKDEKPQIYADPKLSSHHIAKQADNAVHGKNSGHHDKQIIDNEQEQRAREAERFHRDSYRNSERYNNAASLKFSSASTDDATVVNSLRTGDRYSQRKSTESDKSDLLDEVSKRKDKGRSELESSSEEIASFDKNVTRKYSEVVPSHSYSSSSDDDKEDVLKKNENVAFFEDVMTEKQSSRASSRSHSSTFGDIHEDIFKRNGPSENPSVHNDGSIYRNTSEINSSDNTLMFDDYCSDEDNNKVDVGDYKGQETSSYFSSLSRKPSANLFAADSPVWPPRNTDEELRKSTSQSHPPEFSESLKGSSVASQQDVLPPAAFDDYDSQDSDCEEHFGKSKLLGGADFDNFSSEMNLNSKSSEPLHSEDHILQSSTSEAGGSRRNSWLPTTSVDQFPKEVHPDRSQGLESSSVSEKKFNYAELSPRLTKSELDLTAKDALESFDTTKDIENTKESSFESSTQELSFGTLKGGLRNKSNRRPLYTRKSSENSVSVEQDSKGSFSRIEQSSSSPTIKTSIGSGADKQDPHSEEEDTNLNNNVDVRTFAKPTDSFDNHLEEEFQQETSSIRQPYTQKLGIELNKKSNLRGLHNYFDLDNSDSEEDLPKLTPTRNAYPGFGISRRTKASPSDSGRTYSKTNVLSGESTTPKYSAEVKTTTPKYRAETKTNVFSDESITLKYRAEAKTDVFSGESRTPKYSAESKSSSGSFHAKEVLPKPSPETKFSDYSVEQYTPKPILESRRSSHTESPKSTPRKQASNVLYASVEEDSPKPIPDSNRSSRLSSTSEQTSNSHRVSLQQNTPKPIPASIFSPIESSKPSRRERPSKYLPKNTKSGVTESSKPSVIRESSSNDKTGHVHPKLPDSDSFTAFFQSLKQTRE